MCSKPKSEYENWSLTYTTRQSSKVSYFAQNGFTVCGKGVQLIIVGSMLKPKIVPG